MQFIIQSYHGLFSIQGSQALSNQHIMRFAVGLLRADGSKVTHDGYGKPRYWARWWSIRSQFLWLKDSIIFSPGIMSELSCSMSEVSTESSILFSLWISYFHQYPFINGERMASLSVQLRSQLHWNTSGCYRDKMCVQLSQMKRMGAFLVT